MGQVGRVDRSQVRRLARSLGCVCVHSPLEGSESSSCSECTATREAVALSRSRWIERARVGRGRSAGLSSVEAMDDYGSASRLGTSMWLQETKQRTDSEHRVKMPLVP